MYQAGRGEAKGEREFFVIYDIMISRMKWM